MNIPDEQTCVRLLTQYATPPHIVAHSRAVWSVAELLAGRMEPVISFNVPLLKASCLLHDIGKYPSILEGGPHDRRGEEILQGEGFPEVADIIVQHVVLRTREPIAEEHLVFYADKRVVHDKVVTLEDRFEYLMETYGGTALAKERLLLMRRETERLEDAIFTNLEITPAEVIYLVRP